MPLAQGNSPGSDSPATGSHRTELQKLPRAERCGADSRFGWREPATPSLLVVRRRCMCSAIETTDALRFDLA